MSNDSLLIHPRNSGVERSSSPAPTTAAAPHAQTDIHDQANQLAVIRKRYIRDWTLVKRARFNAAQRLKEKNDASLLAFAIAGVVGFVFPFFTILFAEELSKFTIRTFDFVAYITGGLSLTLGLMDQMRDNGGLAKRFHTCGMEVNKALRQLRNNPAITSEKLDELVRQYERALEACDANHDAIDEELSEAQARIRQAERNEKSFIEHGGITTVPDSILQELADARKSLNKTKFRLTVQTYRLYYCVWLLPTLIGLLAWTLLQPAG